MQTVQALAQPPTARTPNAYTTLQAGAVLTSAQNNSAPNNHSTTTTINNNANANSNHSSPQAQLAAHHTQMAQVQSPHGPMFIPILQNLSEDVSLY